MRFWTLQVEVWTKVATVCERYDTRRRTFALQDMSNIVLERGDSDFVYTFEEGKKNRIKRSWFRRHKKPSEFDD